jgi:hypothetical protein
MKLFASAVLTLLVTSGLFAQSLYDINTVQDIKITFAQSNWDALLDAEKAGNEDYIMAQTVEINGVLFDSVGVKYKGNSTYSANQTKNPFHIELDTYKEQDYQNYTDIKLSNVKNDPSFVREVLSYEVLRNYMDAPLSNYANVTINGTLIGLYSNSESVSKKFMTKRFGSKTNARIKCNPPAGAGPGSSDYPNLVYLGQDSSLYTAKYELKSDYGWDELINLCDTLENNINDIDKILDVDRALWMIAFNNILVNLDSYIGGFAQNYYLYRADNGRFIPIVWDLNESFGVFTMTGSGNLNTTASKQQMTHLLHENDASFPLVKQLLSNPTYKKMYLAHCKTILEDNFTNNGAYYTSGQSMQTTIDAHVQADQNKFYTYANFTSNLTADVSIGGGGPGGGKTAPGITNLMNGRYSHLMNQSDFTATEPSISAITLSNTNPAPGDVVTFTANVMNTNSVYIGHRNNLYDVFEKTVMYDDGMHNDGAANDNVFGADLTLAGGTTQYYIYAENNDIGKFSPTNAEHEFYSVEAIVQPAGDLVINEFLASNDTVVADQDGEFDDWIELYNKGNSTIDLSLYSLSDDASDLGQFTFPAGATLAANSYVIIWADKDLTQSGYHADFKLSADGETLYLSDATLNFADSIEFTAQTTDISFGRYPNGTGSFSTMNPTFAAVNMVNNIGLEENYVLEDVGLKIYPNPAEYIVNIEVESENEMDLNVDVYNTHGQLVYTGDLQNSKVIDTSSWSSGMYFVIVGNTSEKLIIR